MPSASKAIDLVVKPKIISTTIVTAVSSTTHLVFCSWLCACVVILSFYNKNTFKIINSYYLICRALKNSFPVQVAFRQGIIAIIISVNFSVIVPGFGYGLMDDIGNSQVCLKLAFSNHFQKMLRQNLKYLQL